MAVSVLLFFSGCAGAAWQMLVWSDFFSFFMGLGRARDTKVYRALRAVRAELMPFRYVIIGLIYLPNVLDGTLLGWNTVWLGMCLLGCWLLGRGNDDDDDRWKRRRKKLADKVAEVGGKLTVVPAGAPS